MPSSSEASVVQASNVFEKRKLVQLTTGGKVDENEHDETQMPFIFAVSFHYHPFIIRSSTSRNYKTYSHAKYQQITIDVSSKSRNVSHTNRT